MRKEVRGLIVKREDGSEQVNYDDDHFPSYINDGWIKPNVPWAGVPHFHEDVELMTIKHGRLAYSVNGRQVILEKGDSIFVNSNQIHYTVPLEEEAVTYVIFIARPNILNSSVAVEMQALQPIVNNPKLPYLRFREINENTEQMREIMLSLPDLRRDPFEVTRRFFDLWSIILRQSKNYGMLEEDAQTDNYTRSFKSMMFFIQQNHQGAISLDDIAQSGNISKSLCNKVFHKYVGDSPVNYLLNYRVRKAAELLRTTALPLSEIAVRSGFNGASYMSEMFKKFFEMTPRGYRKLWQANAQESGSQSS